MKSFAAEHAHGRNRFEVELLDGNLPKAHIHHLLRQPTRKCLSILGLRAAMPRLDRRRYHAVWPQHYPNPLQPLAFFGQKLKTIDREDLVDPLAEWRKHLKPQLQTDEP